MYLKFSAGLPAGDAIDAAAMSALDVYALGARYYDPVIGQFTSFDTYEGPNSSPISLNKYLYANADPVDGSDPSGHFDLVEFGITSTINAIQFGIRIAPVARIAFGIVDAITASEIIYKGINEGFDKITPLEWTTLGLSTIGAVTAVPGTNLLVKSALSAFLHVPLTSALGTFNGARLAIGQLVKLEEITTVEKTAAGAERVGQFLVDGVGNPVIRYLKTDNEFEDTKTLLHELFHYAEWVARGKPPYATLLAATTSTLEEAAEAVADLVLKLVKS